jgi:hypothetical protein
MRPCTQRGRPFGSKDRTPRIVGRRKAEDIQKALSSDSRCAPGRQGGDARFFKSECANFKETSCTVCILEPAPISTPSPALVVNLAICTRSCASKKSKQGGMAHTSPLLMAHFSVHDNHDKVCNRSLGYQRPLEKGKFGVLQLWTLSFGGYFKGPGRRTS